MNCWESLVIACSLSRQSKKMMISNNENDSSHFCAKSRALALYELMCFDKTELYFFWQPQLKLWNEYSSIY